MVIVVPVGKFANSNLCSTPVSCNACFLYGLGLTWTFKGRIAFFFPQLARLIHVAQIGLDIERNSGIVHDSRTICNSAMRM